MATAVEMGEVDDIHSKSETVTDPVVVNGDLEANDGGKVDDEAEEEIMDVDASHSEDEEEEEEEEEEEVKETSEDAAEPDIKDKSDSETVEESTMSVDGNEEAEADAEVEAEVEAVVEVHHVDDNSEDETENAPPKSPEEEEQVSEPAAEDKDTVVLNESNEEDLMIVENDVKENGTVTPEKNNIDVITLSTPSPAKSITKKAALELTPRRSSRNVNKKIYRDTEESEKESVSEESDIEEILPQDPLACVEPLSAVKLIRKPKPATSTIVVKDTKRLVEIASKTSPSVSGKKEPTLVIIDTNSILSGRGPVPIQKSTASTPTSSFPIMPVALPAQGVYPPNMRATITPIPMGNQVTMTKTLPPLAPAPTVQTAAVVVPPPILPSLTDDMFVVEAPSFIVPYVYEKPPVKDLKEYVKKLADEVRKAIEEEKKREDEREREENKTNGKKSKTKEDGANDSEMDEDEDDEDVIKMMNDDEKKDPTLKMDVGDDSKATSETKRQTFFDSPIGKFFVDIGSNLVQEYVQNDLLRQQKRKREREQGQNKLTNKTIQSLLKSLEYTKENNAPFKMTMKKCEFCSYKTESALAMAFHLETPHMKNFVYKCNFCTYEVRSPHDILFHMEAEHCVRGRLERAPAFHQCPNCPFEDNQKGKLSRHNVACARKFKPERNLEAPIDWEPPAKIPRAPRMKQQSLSTTAAMYQAMAKPAQMQQFMKMQQQHHQQQQQQQQQQHHHQHQSAINALNRGRGRPSLGGMASKQLTIKSASPQAYKSAVPGGAAGGGPGSVLVPTNYQISGNQLFQVIAGQDMASRLGGSMGLLTSMSGPSAVSIQNATNKPKSVHQPSISITPLPRGAPVGGASSAAAAAAALPNPIPGAKPGDSTSRNSFVICEICDGYIKDLEQLRNHMQWIHKVKIHPKMIYNRPPLNCQKCQFRFFTDQGLERHLLGSHGLVTSSMQEAANKCKDAGRCPVCGRVYQWKLLNHVARDHNMTLKPAHLSYKCTVCTATFGMYKQFENHVYSAHSVVAKRSMEKKNNVTASPGGGKSQESLLKPLKINDEITIIPQMPKSNGAGSSKEGSPATGAKMAPGTSKIGDTTISRAERLARRKTSMGDN